jgi:hypothetical protein
MKLRYGLGSGGSTGGTSSSGAGPSPSSARMKLTSSARSVSLRPRGTFSETPRNPSGSPPRLKKMTTSSRLKRPVCEARSPAHAAKTRRLNAELAESGGTFS